MTSVSVSSTDEMKIDGFFSDRQSVLVKKLQGGFGSSRLLYNRFVMFKDLLTYKMFPLQF